MKFLILSMFLLYFVDITDHEGLLSLLLGAADIPPQMPQRTEMTTQPVNMDVQTKRATEPDRSKPDMPHQDSHKTAGELPPAAEKEQELLWRLITGQGSRMAAIRKYKTKLVNLMDQLVSVAKNLYMLEVKGKMSDENILFAHDIIEAAKEINERAEYLDLYGRKILKAREDELKRVDDYDKHFHEKAKEPLKPSVGKEIMIDEDISIIPHQLSEKGQGKTHFNPAKEKPFIVKVEAPDCPSPDEDYEDACEEARKSGRPLPEKKKEYQWLLLRLLLLMNLAKNLRKNAKGNQAH